MPDQSHSFVKLDLASWTSGDVSDEFRYVTLDAMFCPAMISELSVLVTNVTANKARKRKVQGSLEVLASERRMLKSCNLHSS